MPELTERDRGLLQNKIDELNSANTQLLDGIETDLREVNNLLLFDIPYKKYVDEKHYNIYAFEEELRLLTGRTIIGPVEEDAFWVTAPEADIFIQIKDGRFIAKKDDVVIVDVPIIPYRAFVVGSECGPNFDIWTRDRYGSTTSETGVPQLYTINEGNNKIKVKINGVQYEVKIVEDGILEAKNGELVVDPFVLSSSIGLSLNEVQVEGVAVLENVQCMYNQARQTFTLCSNTVGPMSTAEVVVEETNDIAYEMKFSNQTQVPGRYANNKLKVSIDGEIQTLEMIFDIRIATYSPLLGYAIDDFSADWRWDFSKGPLFPATPNNGAKIATMIQNKLRENSAGFEKAQCTYYTDSNKFIIYSGTFGIESSIQILPADDVNRDMAPFVGLDVITDTKSHEYAFTTIQSLYDYLNKWTSLSCSRLSNPTKSCYSLLSLLDDITVSDQQFILQTTSEYDYAHLGQPRLYSNKLRVDDTNNKIDIIDGGVKEIVLPHGNYSESELAELIQDYLNYFGTTLYTITYKSRPQVFVISVADSVTFLWNTGVNKATSIGTYIGFPNFANVSGTSFVSDIVSFAGEDFFSMASIPQLIPVEWFDWYPPYYYDFEFGESNWLTILQILLGAEDNAGTDALDLLKNQADFYNEVLLNHWEHIAARELEIETDQYEALRQEIAFYSRISTTDATYLNKVAALNASIANRNNLLSFAVHASIMNIRSSSQSFVEGSDYNEGAVEPLTIDITPVSNDDRIYNRPAPEFRYADNKYLPMRNSTALYSSIVDFRPFDDIAFTILSNKNAIPGFAVSGTDVDGLFTIDRAADTNATMLSLNSEPYDLTGALANTIEVSVDGTTPQTAVIQANAAYVESTNVLTDSVFVVRNTNNKIDYNDGSAHTVTIANGIYSGSSLRIEIENKLQAESPGSNFTVSWSSNQFTINSTPSVNYLFASGPNGIISIGKMIGFPIDVSGTSVVSATRNIYIQTNINDEFSAMVNGISSGSITIAETNYTIASMITTLESAINAKYIGDPVDVTNNADKIRISTIRRGIGATISVTIGVNDLLAAIYMNTATPVVGSGDVFDLSAATAVEVGDKISVSINDLVAGGESGKVRATTTTARGTLNKIDFLPNPFTTVIGLFVKPVGLDQNNKLSVAIDGIDAVISLNTNTSPITGDDVATDMQIKLRAIGSGGFVNSFAYYDRYDYPDKFKIVSGSLGPASSVLVSEKTIVIDATNNKIDFEELSGTQLTATIASGLYDGSLLATAVKVAMDAAGASTYTVTYNPSTKKITIASNGAGGGGIFTLLFGSGTSGSTAATILGYYRTNKFGPLSYVSDAPIKLQQCFFEVNYDTQTNEPGHNIVDSRLSLTDTYISCIVYWSTGNVEDFRYYFVDYPDINSLLDILALEQPDYEIQIKSSLWSRYPEKYVLNDDDEFKIRIGTGSEQSETFSMTTGSSISDLEPAEVTTASDTLTLRINGESAQTITMPTNTMNASHTAEMIQTLVRVLQASSVENQPGYSNFICTYSGDRYYLYSGTQGTNSSVNVTGGTLSSSLKLGSNETVGTGDVANNWFVTIAELIAKFSFTDVDIINDNNFLKFYSEDGEKIEVISTDMATKLGFFADNLIVNPVVDLSNVLSASLRRFSNQTIHQHYPMSYVAIPASDLLIVSTPYAIQTGDVLQVTSTGLPPDPLNTGVDYYAIYVSPTQIRLAYTLQNAQLGIYITLNDTGSGINQVVPNTEPFDMFRGYENRGDITVSFYITDDSLIDSRRPFVVARKSTVSNRISQINARVLAILSELTPTLYDERWQEIIKRLNKKNGSYFKVGEKELGIIRSQETITENLTMISEIEAILEA